METTKPTRKLGLFGQANRLAVTTMESTANTIVAGLKSVENGAQTVAFNAMQMRDESASEYLFSRINLEQKLKDANISQETIDAYLSTL